MWYYITIRRDGKLFYVVSPHYAIYELSEAKDRNTYLWLTEEDCKNDQRWQHLVRDGDEVKYNRNYRG